MTYLKTQAYTLDELEAAVALSQLKWSQTVFNETAPNIHLTIPSPPPVFTSASSQNNFRLTSIHKKLIAGPSSAPDFEPSDSDSNDRGSPEQLKYKLSLFERYKKEQRLRGLMAEDMNNTIRVTAGDRSTKKAVNVDTQNETDDKRPNLPRSRVGNRNTVTPLSRRKYNIRNAIKRNRYSDSSDESITDGDNSSRKTKFRNITVSTSLLQQLGNMTANKATRKLLIEVFPRRILATHSLTGRPSPAFPDKPVKKRLNPAFVKSIIELVVERCRATEKDVRMSITTKLADECKMQRTRQRMEI